jgi:hypothetical protein
MSDNKATDRDFEVLCKTAETEAAWLLGKSVRWVDDMVSQGKLSTVRDSRSRMLYVDELRNLPLVRRKDDGAQFEMNLKEIQES